MRSSETSRGRFGRSVSTGLFQQTTKSANIVIAALNLVTSTSKTAAKFL